MNDYEEHFGLDDSLIIAFAGGPQNRYQWGNVLAKLKLSHVLMRDSSQRYHHYGVEGIGDQGAVAAYICSLRSQYSKIVTVGVSSGAYPALLYGQLAAVDEVVVISALTGRTRAEWSAEDWPHIVDPANPEVELMPLFVDGPIPKVRAFISDGKGTRLDRAMIERIGVTDVTVIPGYAHEDLARGMRDVGMFEGLFR